MKRIFLILSISVILFTLTSCGEKPALKAQNISNKFLEKFFTFKDTDKIIDSQSMLILMKQFSESFKPYMTERGYNIHTANRDLLDAFCAASLNRCNISVSNIKTTFRREYKEFKYYVMDYSLDVIATPLSGDKETKFPITGEITVKQDGKKFLVQDYRYCDSREWISFFLNLPDVK